MNGILHIYQSCLHHLVNKKAGDDQKCSARLRIRGAQAGFADSTGVVLQAPNDM